LPGLVIGLTGGIGSGKSTVADLFAAKGAALVDTDLIAHALTGPGGAAMPALQDAFGNAIVAADGRLDRQAMRRLAFADPGARTRLEGILHPMIRAETERQAAAALAGTAPYVMLVVPLLAESGDYRRRVARVVVVDCREETQITRVMARSGLTREEALRIMAAQASRSDRLAIADDIIDNDGPPENLPAQVGRLHADYLRLAGE
jgi:dephospho-CoA kinase